MARSGAVLQHTYVLGDRLGAGGMGEVFVASHTRLQKKFAVKLLAARHADSSEAFARFRREAEIASRLGHPHIVEVVDFNETDDGQPFLVMELLDGEDLAHRTRRGLLDVPTALRIADQILSALAAAHDADVVHRDLKPQNVFLARRGKDDAWVKLLDFGISKIRGAESDVTQSQVVIGTPGYMSPEQAEGKTRNVDARSDQFAAAVIVYEMLTGVCPFTGDSIPSTLYRVVHHEPPRIDAIRPAVDAHVVAAVARAMAKRAGDRFPDVATFAAALRGEVHVPEPAPVRRMVIGGTASASVDTLMSANTEVSTGDQTRLDRPPRRGKARWAAAGIGVVAVGVLAFVALREPEKEPEPATVPAAVVRPPDAAPVIRADAAVPDAAAATAAETETEMATETKTKPARKRKPAASTSASTSTSTPEPVVEPVKEPPKDAKPKEDDFITDF